MKRRTYDPDYPPRAWVKIIDLYTMCEQPIADINATLDTLRQHHAAAFADAGYVSRDAMQTLLDQRAIRLRDRVMEIKISRYSRDQTPVGLNNSDRPIIAFLAAHDLHDPDGRFEGKTRKAADKIAVQAYQGR